MNSNIEKIVIKYLTDSATVEDLDMLSDWIEFPKNKLLFKEYVKVHYAINYVTNDPEADMIIANLLEDIKIQNSLVYKLKTRRIYQYGAAAIVVLMLSIGYFLNKNNIAINNMQVPIIVNNNIKHGIDKATLTLNDGTEIFLENGSNYQSQNVVSNGEKISYQTSEKEKNSDLKYNYLAIPRGGEFFVELSDGTKVWLNSETKIKYPVSFLKNKPREVELLYGEAYFDVTSSENYNGTVFKVYHKLQEVTVLGTEFNIKAYQDETKIHTTLVEGRVTLDAALVKQLLLPSQQTVLDVKNGAVTVSTVDTQVETSWKDGIFNFDHKTLKDIMRVLSRWYDIDVIFVDKKLENKRFNGLIKKNYRIEDILLALQNTNSINNFEIKNKQIILK